MRFTVKRALFALIVFSSSGIVFGQVSSGANLNFRYHFPFSIGAEYVSLSPFASYRTTFNVYEIDGRFTWPIPTIPVLQPEASIGLYQFDSVDPADPTTWDHTHWTVELGMRYATRMSKEFEIGGEALAGYSLVTFPKLLSGQGTVATGALAAEVGGVLSLDPSYNVSVSIHPSLKYIYLLNPLTDFNGLIFGVGFQVGYRAGQDPDSPQSVIRSLRFDSATVEPLFAAMQSYYVKHPIGRVTITNTDRVPVTDLSVSFDQKGYMDSPTQSARVASLAPGESKTVDLLASFNSQVFTTEGATPLTGDIIVDYNSGGRAAEQHQSVTYDLYDKTAMTWNDDRKVGAFITPADSALRNYASFIRQSTKQAEVAGLNPSLQYAIELFGALGELGILYQSDPTSPFTAAQGHSDVVDSVNIARDTLKRTTGDCDDLTVLYDSMLETAGVPTGFITIPGHIFAAFDTHVPSRDYASLNPDRSMTLSVDGELWIPVEITLIGRAGFVEAWKTGVQEYAQWEAQPDNRKFYRTADAQALFRPVGLKETDLGLQYGSKDRIVADFKQEVAKVSDAITRQYVQTAERTRDKRDYNRLGIVYAQLNQTDKARAAFQQALTLDRGYLNAKINLANLLFLSQQYRDALNAYLAAQTQIQSSGGTDTPTLAKLLLNIAKSYYALSQYDQAQSFYAKASKMDASAAESYAYLADGAASKVAGSDSAVSGGGNGAARAASAGDRRTDVLFLDSSSTDSNK